MHRLLLIYSFISRMCQWVVIGVIVSSISIVVYLYSSGMRQLLPYIILSGSMTPEIPTGAVVLVQPQELYTVGDVITFSTSDNQSFVTHRIVSVDRGNTYYGNEVYETRGDANKTIDPERVNAENIQGKVVFSVPYVGYAVSYMKTPKGFLLFVVIPATIIVYEELKNMKKELQKIIKKFLKRNAELEQPPVQLSTNTLSSVPIIVILIPLITSFSFSVLQSGAFLKDAEKSIGSVIGAASSYAKPNE